MSRRQALRITAVSGAAALFAGASVRELLRAARLHRVRVTRTRMGTLVSITVIDTDAEAARAAVDGAFAEIEGLEALLSRHRSDTPVARLNSTGALTDAPPELAEILRHASWLSEVSQGAFDVTVAPLLQLYGAWFAAAGRRGRAGPGSQAPPPAAAVREALDLVDHRAVLVEGSAVRLDRPGMAITLDGIAKGYVVDRTVSVLEAFGAERILVDAGGDMMGRAGPDVPSSRAARQGGGRPGSPEPWAVGIQEPSEEADLVVVLGLADGGVATSGDYMRAFTEDRRHHPIIDPRTGYSPTEASAATVLAPSAMRADALSTAALVLGPTAGLALLEAVPDTEGMVIHKSGDRSMTSGMPGRLLGV